MKLRKDKWDSYKLGELTFIKGGKRLPKGRVLVNFKTNYPYLRVTDFENNTVNFETILYLLEEDFQKIKNYTISKNDVFISIAGTIGLIGIIPENLHGANLTENAAKLVIKNEITLNQKYLLCCLLSPQLQEEIKNNTATTAQPKLGLNKIANLSIPLPPLEEQIQIASLFQSIETATEQVEGQEWNLNELLMTLNNDLLKEKPIFGNLLNDENCRPIKFGQIVDCIEKHDKQKKDISRFIGLENIEPGNLTIETWGEIENGTTFTKRFSKGDVLFGKRRAYLKKVAVAGFDGICSGDILVFRAKEGMILPGLLPYYAAAEPFIQLAVTTSAGSLSPRTKWKDLAEFQVSIPDLSTQERILGVFQQFQTTIQQLKQQKSTLKDLKQKLLEEILG